MSARLCVHASNAMRRDEALAFARSIRGRCFVVGARIDTARALVADLAIDREAVSGVEATTLDGLAARLARPSLAREGLSIARSLAIDTAAAQALAALGDTLPRMGPLRAAPGMPRAIGRTITELWAADLGAGSVAPFDPELAAVLAHAERTLASDKLVSRARVLERAVARVLEGALDDAHIVLLDVVVATRLGAELARAIASRAASALFTVPEADRRTLVALAGLEAREPAPRHVPTAALAASLFSSAHARPAADVLEAIVARSEAAEAAEITRRVLAAARARTPLHRIAIVLRKPELARATLEGAFRAARIPLAQRRGVRRPDPSGRALLALLTCRADGLSARSFAAYLSFGVMPASVDGQPPLANANATRRALDDEDDDDDESKEAAEPTRVPRTWEALLVETAVIGGDPDRWRRRLAGSREDLTRRAAELDRKGGESARVRRTIDELASLERFALPLLDDLAALPPHATVRVYREQIAAIATRALASPKRALDVLDELTPRTPAGEELAFADFVRVLAPRLGAFEARPETTGVQVLTPDELRGASFDIVIIPGLCERVFPARAPEDPLLPDALRRALSADLEDAHARAQNERTLLSLAVGAAERQVIALASIATSSGDLRVPSVYFVELLGRQLGRLALSADLAMAMSAAVGTEARADEAARSTERAIALTRELTRLSPDDARGRAHHLVLENAMLAGALRRARRRKTAVLGPADGLVLPSKQSRAPLALHDPSKRAYSASTLESFAACPLRFYFKALLLLEPRDEPTRLEKIDPMLRGSIMHEAQFLTLVALRDEGALPLSVERTATAHATLSRVLAALRESLVERLVPAIPRMFHEELDLIGAELREWLTRMCAAPAWQPRFFELAFGLAPEPGRDPASRTEPVVVEEGFTLRGAIDLVEQHAETGALRATDHKTGSNYPIRGRGKLVVRGGQTLQPVLYALALAKLHPEARVESGRLWYCTSKGEFREKSVPLDDDARSAARDVAEAISEALARGHLPALPLDGACTFCDYAPACGPKASDRARLIPAENVERAVPRLVALRRRA